MTSAEIMTFLLVSATHFQANFRKTRLVVRALKFFPRLISESRMNRKIREILEEAWILVFQVLSKALSKKGLPPGIASTHHILGPHLLRFTPSPTLQGCGRRSACI